jgi:hypothetical protein
MAIEAERELQELERRLGAAVTGATVRRSVPIAVR